MSLNNDAKICLLVNSIISQHSLNGNMYDVDKFLKISIGSILDFLCNLSHDELRSKEYKEKVSESGIEIYNKLADLINEYRRKPTDPSLN